MKLIAVLIPCYNEEATIAKVINDFRAVLPGSDIYVYDNNSTDNTVEIANQAKAIVKSESRQGKGWVVRTMFADIEADYYVLVDGDATYDAKICHHAISICHEKGLDLLNISRINNEKAYRAGHQIGNKLFNKVVKWLFGKGINDMLSGYKVFSKRFVKSFPVLSSGFEIETELTIFALAQNMKIDEITAPYYERPEGSFSKLSTYKDGFKILCMIIKLLRYEKPLFLFSTLALVLLLIDVMLDIPLMKTYLHTGLVPRFPTAILITGTATIAFVSFFCGLILDGVTCAKREMQRLFYLNIR
jgi:glycosyltransferase involved in cell wall biosynthesis